MGIVSDFNKKFDEKVVFDNYYYHFSDVGIYFVLGKSGVGKTTLLRSISGLDKDYSGRIEGFGRVSMMFQEYRLFPWISALDNVVKAIAEKPDENDKIRAETLLSELGFSSDEMSLKPSALSGGMKQRVSFARALLANADTVILDEPFKELDSSLVDVMYKIILRESEKRLFIIVTHDEIPKEILEISNVIEL